VIAAEVAAKNDCDLVGRINNNALRIDLFLLRYFCL